ncbi:hypothetical protein [Bacillus sp. USDA818B3_A]|uniref:hypothetical protein n=1 Tax=Bacillus sp. USDA818B3_A TaxID=2698834 RepID=UPI0013719CB4|nr:hypothetical protein [Bacillus sp. USDA818B3_A]
MPTADKAEKIYQLFNAMEKQDKNEMMDLIQHLQASDLITLSKVAPLLRSRLRAITAVEIELVESADAEENEVTEEEQIELNKLYGNRAQTPPQEFIKYKGPDQLLDMIMKNKEQKGWKFKDEQ